MNNEEKKVKEFAEFLKTYVKGIAKGKYKEWTWQDIARHIINSANSMSQNELRAVGNNEVREVVCEHPQTAVTYLQGQKICLKCRKFI